MNCEYCAWINKVLVAYKEKLPRKKINVKKKYKRDRRLEPIIIVHGVPDGEKIDKETGSLVEIIKKIVIEKYEELLKGKTATEIVELMIKEFEKLSDLKGETWRETILADDKGGLASVAGLIQDHSVFLAKNIFNRKNDIFQVINNFQDEDENVLDKLEKQIKEKNDNHLDIKSGCWSVIVRDLEENLSCGRTNWNLTETPNETLRSINSSTTVYGCGIFLQDESCCSVSGDDEKIYLFALAKKISQLIEEKQKHLSSKNQIDEFLAEFKNISCVFLGPCERPVISFQSDIFPWIYCCKEKIYSGDKKGDAKIQLIDQTEAECRCYFE